MLLSSSVLFVKTLDVFEKLIESVVILLASVVTLMLVADVNSVD
jgi:hypothetical protein